MPYKNKEDRIKYQRDRALLGKHPCKKCGKPTGAELCGSCSAKYAPKHHKAARGNKHHSWQGGRVNNGGYIMIYAPGHPRARHGGIYVLEHILVWEQVHGKSLPEGWIIHHLNGIKNDNRPSNLVGLPNMKHYLVLQAKAKRIQELEALLNHQGHLL